LEVDPLSAVLQKVLTCQRLYYLKHRHSSKLSLHSAYKILEICQTWLERKAAKDAAIVELSKKSIEIILKVAA
jgi:hypothetical protein